jgi:hypothetical protein
VNRTIASALLALGLAACSHAELPAQQAATPVAVEASPISATEAPRAPASEDAPSYESPIASASCALGSVELFHCALSKSPGESVSVCALDPHGVSLEVRVHATDGTSFVQRARNESIAATFRSYAFTAPEIAYQTLSFDRDDEEWIVFSEQRGNRIARGLRVKGAEARELACEGAPVDRLDQVDAVIAGAAASLMAFK